MKTLLTLVAMGLSIVLLSAQEKTKDLTSEAAVDSLKKRMFNLEKSFEDWSKNPTRWQHPIESRDGRILFENFLKLALKHKK